MNELAPIIKELRKTLGKMAVALGSIREAIVWTDQKGNVQWCNAAFDQLVNKPHISVLGSPLFQILPISKDGIPLLKKTHLIQRLLANGAINQELFFSPTTATWLEISGNTICVDDNSDEQVSIFTIKDVTDLKNEQLSLKLSKEKLEFRVQQRTQVLETLSNQYQSILIEAVDAIITIDETAQIINFNPAAEKMFGYKAPEVIGHNVKIIVPPPTVTGTTII